MSCERTCGSCHWYRQATALEPETCRLREIEVQKSGVCALHLSHKEASDRYTKALGASHTVKLG